MLKRFQANWAPANCAPRRFGGKLGPTFFGSQYAKLSPGKSGPGKLSPGKLDALVRHIGPPSPTNYRWTQHNRIQFACRLHTNIFQGPNLLGPILPHQHFLGTQFAAKNHKESDLTHQGPSLPAQGSNLPGPHLPQKITRGLICWGPICREPPEEGCSKFIKILQS